MLLPESSISGCVCFESGCITKPLAAVAMHTKVIATTLHRHLQLHLQNAYFTLSKVRFFFATPLLSSSVCCPASCALSAMTPLLVVRVRFAVSGS